MKRRILVWAYFTKNAGDDLFLKVLFDRYPNVEWELLTANRNYKNVFRDYKNVKIIYTYRYIYIGKRRINLFFKLNDLFYNFRKYDALINIGGSIFKQNIAWEIRLNERRYLLEKFKKMKKKVFIIGANFGPFDDDTFIERYREIFPLYDDICFRDNYSYNIFKDLDNVRLAPDVVFTLDANLSVRKDKIVGFSLIDIEKRDGLKEFYHNYNEKMIQLIKMYLELGYKIKLFSFCEYEGDLKISHYIAGNELFKKNQIKVVNYDGNLIRFLNEFKSCEIIIGTRFHSIILALLFNQSVFPIIYSDKTINTLIDLNMESHNCYIKDIHKLKIKSVLDSVNYNKVKNRKVLVDAEKQFEKLDLFIGLNEANDNKEEFGIEMGAIKPNEKNHIICN